MSTNDNQKIKEDADKWAKSNRRRIAKEFLAAHGKNTTESQPLALFLAGSPAAGKTEVAHAFIKMMKRENEQEEIIHLDPDYFRQLIPHYAGYNSELFQGASSRILNRCFDVISKAKRTFIFDSTLANFARAKSNISRCLEKQYTVRIVYVYQDAIAAWETAKIREKNDGRHVPMHAFVERYFSSKQTVNELKEFFGDKIQIDLIIKDIVSNERLFKFNINKIDNHIDEKYNPESLLRAMNKEPNHA